MRSHLVRVDVVVGRVRAHEADVDQPVGVVHPHHQAVFVPGDVEADPVVREEAGVPVVGLHLGRRFPVRALRELEPSLQGLLRVGVLLPKGFQGLAGDDSHGVSLAAFPFWKQTAPLPRLPGSMAAARAAQRRRNRG